MEKQRARRKLLHKNVNVLEMKTRSRTKVDQIKRNYCCIKALATSTRKCIDRIQSSANHEKLVLTCMNCFCFPVVRLHIFVLKNNPIPFHWRWDGAANLVLLGRMLTPTQDDLTLRFADAIHPIRHNWIVIHCVTLSQTDPVAFNDPNGLSKASHTIHPGQLFLGFSKNGHELLAPTRIQSNINYLYSPFLVTQR